MVHDGDEMGGCEVGAVTGQRRRGNDSRKMYFLGRLGGDFGGRITEGVSSQVCNQRNGG